MQTNSTHKCLQLGSHITEPISASKFMCKLPKNSCVLQCSVQFNGCYHSQVPKFSQNLFLLLTLSFCQFNMIAKASFVRPTFASSLTDVFSFVLCCFRLFELLEFSVVHLYIQPNRINGIYLIPKMLGSQSRTTLTMYS